MLEEVRRRLIPTGQLLIELERSGLVDLRGGWRRYKASGQLETETGLECDVSFIYRYMKLARFGIEAFEKEEGCSPQKG